MSNEFDLSVVVPMFQSEGTIVELVTRIRSHLDQSFSGRYEIILVNDGSSDNTISVVRSELMGQDLVLIDLMKNYGQLNATMAGLQTSEGNIVVTIDDDLQFPPESIYNLISELEMGLDVVYGIPSKSMQSFHRSLGSRFINWVYRKLFGRKHNRSSFAAIRRPIVDAITGHSGNSHFIDGLILWYTDSVGSIKIEKSKRKKGKSGWGIKQLVRAGLDMVTNYSRSPLLLSAWISFTASLFAFFMGFAYIILTITDGNEVPGWASIFVSISFFSSVQLFTLGIMGEYVARLQLNSNNEPTHLIRTIEKDRESLE